jgi:hypothetical protein
MPSNSPGCRSRPAHRSARGYDEAEREQAEAAARAAGSEPVEALANAE